MTATKEKLERTKKIALAISFLVAGCISFPNLQTAQAAQVKTARTVEELDTAMDAALNPELEDAALDSALNLAELEVLVKWKILKLIKRKILILSGWGLPIRSNPGP